MEVYPKIKRMGERAILLEFKPDIDPRLLEKILDFKNFCQDNSLKQNIEVTNTYNSLLISYNVSIEDAYSEVLELWEQFSQANIPHKTKSRLFSIPVCYDEGFALDLEEISLAKNLSKKEIIDLHSSEIYLVYFTGFLPGFLYLGGLPKVLHFSRRNQPRPRVQKGAVGIGEKQTGIYPQESPGGWNIIGNSPVPLFDPEANPPCQIKSGDRIKFYQVDFEEHQEIKEEVKSGRFEFQFETYNG